MRTREGKRLEGPRSSHSLIWPTPEKRTRPKPPNADTPNALPGYLKQSTHTHQFLPPLPYSKNPFLLLLQKPLDISSAAVYYKGASQVIRRGRRAPQT